MREVVTRNDRDDPRHGHGAPRRPAPSRHGDRRDPSRDANPVTGDRCVDTFPTPTGTGYRPSTTKPGLPPGARGAAGNRPVSPHLGTPVVAPATPQQHHHAVRLLAAMIGSWVQRDHDEPPEDPPDPAP